MNYPQTANAVPHEKDGLLWYTFPLLDAYSDRICHGFSTRIGGVSAGGGLDTLNLGIGRGDVPENVQENYRRFGTAAGFDPAATVFTWQDHHTRLRYATGADLGKGLLRQRNYQGVDGLYTDIPGVTLITHFADCTPLFFYAPDRNIIAASHAGWRGTAAKMGAVTARRLTELGCDPAQLLAVIGPSAGPLRYQVAGDCAAAFRGWQDEEGPILKDDPSEQGKYLLDLWRANRLALREAGLRDEHIAIAGLCTVSNGAVFYSHRLQGNARGSLAGFITLR